MITKINSDTWYIVDYVAGALKPVIKLQCWVTQALDNSLAIQIEGHTKVEAAASVGPSYTKTKQIQIYKKQQLC